MRTVSVAELAGSLAECLSSAKQGEDVVVTEKGKPVVRMVKAQEPETNVECRERLIEQGILAPAKMPMERLSPPPGMAPSGVLEALLDERTRGR